MDAETAMEVKIQQAVMAEKLQRLQEDVEQLSSTLENLTVVLNSLNATLSEARGGWKMLLLVAGSSSAISAAVGYIFHWGK